MCWQGKEVIEYYINELISEGITYIPPWTDPNTKPALTQPPKEDAPSQDSGLRSRSNSVASVHSQNSLVLGATAATIQNTGLPEVHEPGNWDRDVVSSCFVPLLFPWYESDINDLIY